MSVPDTLVPKRRTCPCREAKNPLGLVICAGLTMPDARRLTSLSKAAIMSRAVL
jgi:hypothetical protein